jgi:hypothetical protein
LWVPGALWSHAISRYAEFVNDWYNVSAQTWVRDFVYIQDQKKDQNLIDDDTYNEPPDDDAAATTSTTGTAAATATAGIKNVVYSSQMVVEKEKRVNDRPEETPTIATATSSSDGQGLQKGVTEVLWRTY